MSAASRGRFPGHACREFYHIRSVKATQFSHLFDRLIFDPSGLRSQGTFSPVGSTLTNRPSIMVGHFCLIFQFEILDPQLVATLPENGYHLGTR